MFELALLCGVSRLRLLESRDLLLLLLRGLLPLLSELSLERQRPLPGFGRGAVGGLLGGAHRRLQRFHLCPELLRLRLPLLLSGALLGLELCPLLLQSLLRRGLLRHRLREGLPEPGRLSLRGLPEGFCGLLRLQELGPDL